MLGYMKCHGVHGGMRCYGGLGEVLWGVIKCFGGIGSLRSYAQTDDHLSKADLHPLLARSAQQWESKGGRCKIHSSQTCRLFSQTFWPIGHFLKLVG